jgi:hypothetical protein
VQLIDYVRGRLRARGGDRHGDAGGLLRVAGSGARRIERGAILIFHTAAIALVVRLWLGYGLRDFAIAGFPALLFLGCVFLSARAYWLLTAIIIGGTLVVGSVEVAGLRSGGSDATVRPGSFANLIVVLTATAIGGRALVHAAARTRCGASAHCAIRCAGPRNGWRRSCARASTRSWCRGPPTA